MYKDAFNNVLTTQKFECIDIWQAALELQLHQCCSATHHKLQITSTFDYFDWIIRLELLIFFCILPSLSHKSGDGNLKFTPDIDICIFMSRVARSHWSHSFARKCKYTSWTAVCGFKRGYVASCSFNVEQKHKRGLFSVGSLPGRSLNLRRRGFFLWSKACWSLRNTLADFCFVKQRCWKMESVV